MLNAHSEYNVLIIEDNPGDAILIEDFLFEQIKSLRTTNSKSFRDASNILSQPNCNFDIILLDLSLPDKAGVDLIHEIIKICNNIPIIVLTGYSDLEFGIKTLSMGASDYILKDELNSVSLYKSILYSVERKRITSSLSESEKRYNDLFHLSPLPMWVYDCETLNFLDVNNAAIKNYGYSLDEFLSMTIKEIRPQEDIHLLEKTLAKNMDSTVHKEIFKHKKKNGEIINVDIQTSTILFNEKKAKVIIATDITERLNYIITIENQNEKFREIAWIQSHIVRASVAKIMGLIPLIKKKLINENGLEKLLDYLSISTNELDTTVREISKKASDINNTPTTRQQHFDTF